MKKLLVVLVVTTGLLAALMYVSYSHCRSSGGTENQCLALTITPVLMGLAAGSAAAGAYRR